MLILAKITYLIQFDPLQIRFTHTTHFGKVMYIRVFAQLTITYYNTIQFHVKNSANWRVTQCGNYGNLLSRIFSKDFVKVTVLLKKLLKSWFDEIFFGEGEVSFSHIHEIIHQFAHFAFTQFTINIEKFRDIYLLI